MIETLIVADTLTGSADTGAKFSNGGPVKLVNLDLPDWSGIHGVLTVNTDTHVSAPERIPETLAKVKTLLNDHRPRILYKRIDSCLRGFIGLEIATFLQAFDGLDFALVAPAHPETGCVTIRGIHRVDNKPVHTTKYAKGYSKPVLDSRLKNVIAQDHNLRVETIDIEDIRSGPAAIEHKLKSFRRKGDKFIVACDAEFDYDLDLLAKATKELAEKILFTGSSGLAEVLADLYSAKSHNWLGDEFHPPTPQPPVIFFGGSYSKVLREQFNALAADHGGTLYELDLEALMNGRGQTIPIPTPGKPLIITLPDKSNDEAFNKKYPLTQINEKFGPLAADLAKNAQYNSIFISGGELPRTTLKAMNLDEVWIRSELPQGIVFSSSGPLSILTKQADFGPPEALSQLFRDITTEDDW
ncbi:MAG: four-carbon acid sugar kinase family protein, partial [Deltaproteobacteria bacterium]|nr:four-carbon acid sugar kinase family protein [Deltaproteobacteria bacterium]